MDLGPNTAPTTTDRLTDRPIDRPQEDATVLSLVSKYGAQRWSLIASHLPGRIGKQCRERWHNHLSPEVRKEGFSEEEVRLSGWHAMGRSRPERRGPSRPGWRAKTTSLYAAREARAVVCLLPRGAAA